MVNNSRIRVNMFSSSERGTFHRKRRVDRLGKAVFRELENKQIRCVLNLLKSLHINDLHLIGVFEKTLT